MTPENIPAWATPEEILAWATVALCVTTLLLFLANSAMVLYVRYQAGQIKHGFRIQIHQSQAEFLLQVADRWTKVLEIRYDIRNTPEKYQLETLQMKYDQDPIKFLAGEEWKRLRAICNFYEFIGMLGWSGDLVLEHALVIVTVDRALHRDLSPIIKWLRENYRLDIYLFWDWLIEQTDPDNADSVTAIVPRDPRSGIPTVRPRGLGEM